MSATVIQFNKVQPEPTKPVKCSFCGLPTINALSSGDNTKHICPKCMVKCNDLMKEQDECLGSN